MSNFLNAAQQNFGECLIKFNHFSLLLIWAKGVIDDREAIIKYDVRVFDTYFPHANSNLFAGAS